MDGYASEICPNGHVGRGILIDSEFDDSGHETRLKFKCETCGEVWWEDDDEVIESDSGHEIEGAY